MGTVNSSSARGPGGSWHGWLLSQGDTCVTESLQLDPKTGIDRLPSPGAAPPRDGRAPAVEPEYLRDLVVGMRCGVLSIDRQGRLVMLNDLALQILELEQAPAVGTPVEQALADHPQLARILRESFGMSSLPNRAEIDLRCRCNRGKTIGFTLSLVAGEDGRPYGAAIFFKDLTQVEQKEEQERLKDRLAALGQMAASMAHEIRNPLASIEVSCSLLKRRRAGESEETKLLGKIISEVRRLNGTVTSSLQFVRPLSIRPALADLDTMLAEALRIARERRAAPGIKVLQRLEPGIPAFLMDRGQLRQVFENLFLNALEAMGDRGVLVVETALAPAPAAASIPYPQEQGGDSRQGFDRYVQVRVSDTGPGVQADHLDKLFYPFFTTKKHGSGVGLSVAKKIVDAHRGLLDVESRPGEGAAFTVRLPLAGATLED